MTAQILASELGTLIQDSKRKNSELRSAAEKALQDLKSLPVTSETQLAADLSRRPHFISPFLIACSTQNAKFGSTGVSGLQRLSVSRALPKERLTEVLEAFRDSVSLSNDIQLKILQALPSIVQNYASEIRGDLLAIVLQICSALQNAKNFAVSNTAVATLQQLVISVYDRVAAEDDRALEIPTSTEITIEGESVSVRPAAYDAYKVFNDLNLLVNGAKPVHMRLSSLAPTSILELIEAILSNHGKIVSSHQEQVHILRSLLMPLIIRSLSERLSFPITLRVVRILNILIRNHLSLIPSEIDIALGLLNHMLDPEASPLWKRALCLEVFRGIYSDSRLVLLMYRYFDEQDGKKSIFEDNLGAFVRLATEKPALIGLGQQSTVPTFRGDSKDSASEQAVAEAGALAGVIGGPVPESNANGPPVGLSTQWSALRISCLEHLDKTDPPALPETYIYSLVLTCITNISESLAKFIMPLSVHQESRSRKRGKGEELSRSDSEKDHPPSTSSRLSRSQSFRKKSIPVNPLDLKDHSASTYIQTTSTLVTECWPAVLATCSTFLNAALDDDYYRALVRAIQKFTQVAGLLRLSTPRDAFLTTLGKAAVPPNLLLSNAVSPRLTPSETPSVFSNAKGLLSVDSLVSQASSLSVDKNRRTSHEVSTPSLGPRNLLCLRALLNLAIALGPTLSSAWSIVFETLQVADLVMAMSSNQSGARTPGSVVARADTELASEKLEVETAAVQAAARRLFESTVDFPNDAFVELLQALCSLLDLGSTAESGQVTPTTAVRPQVLHQRRMGSVSGMSLNTDTGSRDSMFALNKIGELAALNEGRLSQYDPTESGWNILISELVKFTTTERKQSSTRLLAADIISRTVKEMAGISMSDEQRTDIQTRILSALQTQISALHSLDDSYSDTSIRIHQIALEALKNVIEQCGESLIAGWDAVFDSLSSVFYGHASSHTENTDSESDDDELSLEPIQVISKPLARSAFGSVQLVCSDFLGVVPDTSLSTLLDLLFRFCCQQDDFNMSLTTITFFWNVSDFLHSKSDLSSLPGMLEHSKESRAAKRLVKKHSSDGSMPALWLQVLLNLAAVTTDRRAELRNTAVQTIQRIFDNYAEELAPSTWMICLHTVPLATVKTNLAIHKWIRKEQTTALDEVATWDETTRILLDSVGALFASYMENIQDSAEFGVVWSDLLDNLQRYFQCRSHALGCSVFTIITTILSRTESARLLDTSALSKTATVWKNYVEQSRTAGWDSWGQDNQVAFVAYAEAFKAIYRLSQHNLDPSLPAMLSGLKTCVADSEDVPYSSDLDYMTPLQTQVIECLSMIESESVAVHESLIRTLSELVTLPYFAKGREGTGKGGPTFVAVSKAAMEALPGVTIKHIKEQGIYPSDAFGIAMKSLRKPIEEKYVWHQEGKAPTLWQKATTATLTILGTGIARVKIEKSSEDNAKRIWAETLGHVIPRVIGVRYDLSNALPFAKKDEEFDMKAFSTLRQMAAESLSWGCVPNALRLEYARDLFQTSIIHPQTYNEEGNRNLVRAPLQDLYRIRFGQTKDPVPVPRTEMAYACYSELISLVTAQDSSPDRVRLAKAAAPYVILRAALPLKAYIADQPLRGLMPAPESLRRELIFTLKELKQLKSEPQAIPNAPGVKSTYRKHLHRLYPLLVKATQVARQDGEVFRYLMQLTETVGDEFGLEDDDDDEERE